MGSEAGSWDDTVDIMPLLEFTGDRINASGKSVDLPCSIITTQSVDQTSDRESNTCSSSYFKLQSEPNLTTGDSTWSAFVSGNITKRGGAAKPPMLMQKAIKAAMIKARARADPWEEFHIWDLPVHKATRHRYNVRRKEWISDTVLVKLEEEPFAAGAMRNCYRLKKLSTIQCENWKQADNYVAKKYIDTSVENSIYFEDVKLQMDAKVWGERYSRCNPPKQIDIFQMSIVELDDSKQLYHLEHFIEGEYIKYNSNSGFVDDSCRFTPHAFSHFSFEQSGHKLIVVDIQGVGDLYTDPQIHTDDGEGYGDGNLGVKGMALFFHSHSCNPICEFLGLSPFDLSESEVADLASSSMKSMSPAVTVVMKRQRSSSSCCSLSPTLEHGGEKQAFSFADTGSNAPPCTLPPMPEGQPQTAPSDIPSGRLRRYQSESINSPISPNDEHFERVYRPSTVNLSEDQQQQLISDHQADSVLARIHLELAKYHEFGRFSQQGEIDEESAIFHLEIGARLRDKECIKAMANICLQKENDVLPSVKLIESHENTKRGIGYMIQAAEGGDRNAMIFMAQAFETGFGLGPDREIDWREAVRFYEQAINTASNSEENSSDSFDACMDEPVYKLTASLARLYHEGLHGLDKDPSQAGDLYNEAADTAMSQFKGQLANKYFELAEIAWGEMEEE